MEATQSLSVVQLILDASLPVQLIMALLVAMSVLSWTRILTKAVEVRTARRHTEDFERAFWSGTDLNHIYQQVSAKPDGIGMEKIFQSGFAEFLKLRRQPGGELSDIMDGTRRAMKAAAQRELDDLDRHTSFLAGFEGRADDAGVGPDFQCAFVTFAGRQDGPGA